jgi:hypothetical protein
VVGVCAAVISCTRNELTSLTERAASTSKAAADAAINAYNKTTDLVKVLQTFYSVIIPPLAATSIAAAKTYAETAQTAANTTITSYETVKSTLGTTGTTLTASTGTTGTTGTVR